MLKKIYPQGYIFGPIWGRKDEEKHVLNTYMSWKMIKMMLEHNFPWSRLWIYSRTWSVWRRMLRENLVSFSLVFRPSFWEKEWELFVVFWLVGCMYIYAKWEIQPIPNLMISNLENMEVRWRGWRGDEVMEVWEGGAAEGWGGGVGWGGWLLGWLGWTLTKLQLD